MEGFQARLGHLSAAGYVVSALILLLCPIAVEWPFSTENPTLLLKILPQRITDSAVRQGEMGIAWLRFIPREAPSPHQVFWSLESRSRCEA